MIEIIASGPLMTVQDLGRPDARRYGVAPGGALDQFALAVANQLVGNAPGAAGIEMTAGGVILRIFSPSTIALTGADLGATIDGQPLPLWTVLRTHGEVRIQLEGRRGTWGARAYLAIAGGIDVPRVLGSRSTNLAGHFGGLHGQPLRPGDHLPVGNALPNVGSRVGLHWPSSARPRYTSEPTLHFIPGPHSDSFMRESIVELCTTLLRVSATSNRMGYRLEGQKVRYNHLHNLFSLGVIPGTIQVPPDGIPILLMADAQPTGGYPIVGVVMSADLPLAAQLLPGDSLRLSETTLEAACNAYQQQGELLGHSPDYDDGDLLANLAGG